MRAAAAGHRIGHVDFHASAPGVAAYNKAVGGGEGTGGFCSAPYPFAVTLAGVDIDALGIDFASGFLAACSFEIFRPLAVGESAKVSVEVTEVRARRGGPGAVATVTADFRVGDELIGLHKYTFVDRLLA